MIAWNKSPYMWAVIVTFVFSAVSELTVGTFSTIRDYIITELDSSVDGRVVKSEMRLTGRWGASSYDIQYRYKVDDTYYLGERINYEIKSYKSEEMIKKYSVGKMVIVYYDSSDPRLASLERTALGWLVYGQILIIVACFFFVVFLFKAMK